jgi:hypothetical protein
MVCSWTALLCFTYSQEQHVVMLQYEIHQSSYFLVTYSHLTHLIRCCITTCSWNILDKSPCQGEGTYALEVQEKKNNSLTVLTNHVYWLFKKNTEMWLYKWDFKFSRRRVWCSESSSGIYCRVKLLSTDVSEVRTASIIRDDSSQKTTLNVIIQSKYVL